MEYEYGIEWNMIRYDEDLEGEEGRMGFDVVVMYDSKWLHG